jgi:hypothetical protein
MHGNSRLPLVPTPPTTDTLTLRTEAEDQLVQTDRDASGPASGPYRDGADAKLARMRNLEAWLARLGEAEAMRGALEREHALLEESIRHERDTLRARVTETTPCSARWEQMQGNDAVRRCGRCRRAVHDLARLSRNEAEALLERAERGEVLALHARPDGRVVMGACPRSERAQTVRAVAAGMIAGAAVATSAFVPYAVVDDMRFDALAERVTQGERTAHRLYLEQRAQEERWEAGEARHADHDRLHTRAHLSLRDSITSLARVVARDEPGAEPTGADGSDVTQIGPNEYLVTRAVLEAPTRLMSAARVIPHEQEGVVLGLRIYGIRRASLLGQMGIQNGDTLVTLNGISLASGTPDALLDAVSDSTAFELVVLRRGEVVRLRYVVLG